MQGREEGVTETESKLEQQHKLFANLRFFQNLVVINNSNVYIMLCVDCKKKKNLYINISLFLPFLPVHKPRIAFCCHHRHDFIIDCKPYLATCD